MENIRTWGIFRLDSILSVRAVSSSVRDTHIESKDLSELVTLPEELLWVVS
jgi:hypothetical protein